MPYIVKYVGNCARNHIDIRPIINAGSEENKKIILVCEKENCAQYYGGDIKVTDNISEIENIAADIILLAPARDAVGVAVECAYRVGGGLCQVYIKNDGLYSADPQQSVFAKRFDKIDYDEVLEICSCGYNDIDISMVELAKKYGVVLQLLSYSEPQGKSTYIREVMSLGGAVIKGVIKEPNVCIISLTDIPDVVGISYRIFQAVSDAGVVVDIISLPASGHGKQDISFTVRKEDKRKAEKVLKEKQAELGYSGVWINDNVTKISVVGGALQSSSGVAARVFRIFYENNINLRLISTSEIKIVVLVDKEMADTAVHKIHEVFIN